MRAIRTRTRDRSSANRNPSSWIITLAVAALTSSAATAADVVDVRIGRHPEYTRVVFELNAPAGYRIERREDADGRPELVVSLSATTSERTVKSKYPLIEVIDLAPKGDDAVAHVALTEQGLRLKEMILANPPRIVLDLISPNPAVATPVAQQAAPVIEPEPAAASQADDLAVASDDEPTGFAIQGESEFEAAIVEAHVENQAALAADDIAMDDAVDTAMEPAPMLADVAQRGPEMPAEHRAPAAAPSPIAKAMPAATPASEESGGFDMMTAGYAVGGIALVGLAAFAFTRRRAGGDAMDDQDDFAEAPMADDTPFTGLETGLEAATEPAEKPDEPEFDFGSGAEVPTAATTSIPSPVEMGDEPVLKGTPMDAPIDAATETDFATASHSDEAVTQVQAPPMPIGSMGAGLDEDGMRLVRELEQRLATVENRLDEVVDARERLERQVAAQTEELRVQRAAIARTQRAVRNMNRPEEDAPTEPALRDPDRPPADGPEA